MGTITAATAIIQFVGLVMFTTQTSAPVGPDPTLKNIPTPAYVWEPLPGRNIAPASSTHVFAILPLVRSSPLGVEDHTALIAFRRSSFVYATGWKPTQLVSDPNDPLLYVELNHEQVTFVASGNNTPFPAGYRVPNVPSIRERCPSSRISNRISSL